MQSTNKLSQIILLITFCLFTFSSFAAIAPKFNNSKASIARIVNSSCPKSENSCEGSCTWSDGSSYEGKFMNGLPNGYGEQSWPDGSYYEGNFAEGFRHGKGAQLLDNGDQYIGTFKRGLMNGMGTYIWANGTVYKGEYKNDNLEGFGNITFTTGASYEGKWKNGKAHGKGIFNTAGGARFVGKYKKGKRHGKGIMNFPNGAILTGNWYNGFLVKEGLFKFNDGDGFWANWKLAKQEGKVKYNRVSKRKFITVKQNKLMEQLGNTERANMATVHYFTATEFMFDKQYEKALNALKTAASLLDKNDVRYDAIQVEILTLKNLIK
ncbi:MAG: hypothetical protein ACI9XB_004537 [Gammaproteobacteria bacterium]|jgi:hypothetical protein